MVPAEVDEPMETASRARTNVPGEKSLARAAAVPQQAMPQDVRREWKAVVIDCLLGLIVRPGGMAVLFILQGRCQVPGTPQTVVFIVFLIMRQARKSGIPDFRKISVRRSGRMRGFRWSLNGRIAAPTFARFTTVMCRARSSIRPCSRFSGHHGNSEPALVFVSFFKKFYRFEDFHKNVIAQPCIKIEVSASSHQAILAHCHCFFRVSND